AEKFPTMTFVSTKVAGGADNLKVTGNLTMKGVTKEVTLIVADPKSLQDVAKREALATATVNRQDFGVSGGAVVGDDVLITIKTELVKQ
ncbi:MAG: YceI family protein, partial [Pelobacteraceae bacterium]